MKEIYLSNGKFTIIDNEDYERVSSKSWWLSGKGYATGKTKGKVVFLHRFIMNPPEDMQCDHINGDKLDNRRCNLRVVTHTQNMRNRKVQSNNKSGIRGVHQEKDGWWYAQIKIDGVQYFLGCFKDKELAKDAYEKAAEKAYGEYRRK